MKLKYSEIISKMSLVEKAYMMSGKNVWCTQDYPEYEIPSMVMSDGPHGMRVQKGEGDHLGINKSVPATCFPTAATIANSWNEELGEEIGKALAEEALSMDVNVILGPGLNIKRSPLCGRNFEYFSEDPYLSGKMAAAYIKGIQSKNIAACPKHYAVNSQELRRMANDSIVDERTLREIYLTGFEIAVKEGKAKAIMSSYNQVNGIYANENSHLLQEILVDEWGFDGFVVSDWGGSNDHVLGIKNGSHLEMPGTCDVGMKEVLKGIEDGVLTEQELDQRLDELLEIIFSTQKKESHNKMYDVEAHHELAQRAAAESIVLLKNEDNCLPLKKESKVLVVGDFAKNPRYQGAGSSLVNPSKTPENAYDCLRKEQLEIIGYSQGYIRNKKPNAKLVEEAIELSKNADIVLVFAGLDEVSECEGMDRTHMQMPKAQNELIKALTSNHKNVVVILSAGSVVEMPWKNDVQGIVHGYLGGQAGASAMVNVLMGRVNPSGKLNETYPYVYADTPAYMYYPGKERTSEFRESLYVGYRYYDSAGIEVNFPFGFGLSYTEFKYDNLVVKEEGVSFTIKNIGSVDGAEIAQLYVGRESETVFRPTKELKGFKKIYLKAGQEREVFIPFDDKTFRFFDVRSNTWEVEGGQYQIMIASDSQNIFLHGCLSVNGTIKEGGYNKADYPSYFSGDITQITNEEFARLYGTEIPSGAWSKEIGINDTFGQFSYAKGFLAKMVYKVLSALKKRSEKKGIPDLNILFIYNMPIRGISRMAGGAINKDMCQAIVEIANGHGIRGIGKFFAAWVKK